MKPKYNGGFRSAKQSFAKQRKNPAPPASDRLMKKALAYHRLGQLPQAETLYQQILQISPDHRDALHLLGLTAHQVGKYAAALELIDKAILLGPDYAEAYSDRGNALERLGQFEAAVESFDKAILLKPDFAEAYNNRGNALHGLRQYQAACASFDNALLLKPTLAEACSNRGNALHQMQQYQAAVESFDKAILLKPDHAQAWANRGGALTELQQYQEALESFDKSILLKLDQAENWSNRGNALQGIQQYEAALESCDRAILLKPDFAEAYNNRGNALHGLRQYQAASESFDKAILLKPDYAKAWNNCGNALVQLQRHHAAVESFTKAIHLKADYAEAYGNRGNALLELCQYQLALESFDQAILLKPAYELLTGTRLHMRQFSCDWDEIESQCRHLERRADRGERVATPFEMLGISSSPSVQKKTAEIFLRDKYRSRTSLAVSPRRAKPDRIRIGYFSADFYNHATCYLMAELFELHDRSKFEIFGFSYGPDAQDGMRERVFAAMDQFVDVRTLPDRRVAQLSRELEVDIAVDLKGLTKDNRVGIFAERAAPIQVNYLGYPGTMGADYMDYLIADHTLIPQASQRHYSEKIVYLPDSYQVNDSQRFISARSWEHAEAGLPEKGFVYCCFNNSWKITPNTFAIWMRILAQVEGSVLWLMEDNPRVGDNLREEAAKRGISPQRLIFAKRLPLADHLARHSLADLFLDTLPCNAHTTASDALWAGLPVLTCMGEAFASRVAASLLRAIDLPELVTTTENTYERLAVELALDAERYQEIRKRLQRNRLTSPLFDPPSFTKHLEAAYSGMHDRYQAGLSPEHIHITGLPNQP
jgi:predicted O-linked N-acetylglucosamine transferase (SPINDLY family)